jgi:hypothetical protein
VRKSRRPVVGGGELTGRLVSGVRCGVQGRSRRTFTSRRASWDRNGRRDGQTGCMTTSLVSDGPGRTQRTSVAVRGRRITDIRFKSVHNGAAEHVTPRGNAAALISARVNAGLDTLTRQTKLKEAN